VFPSSFRPKHPIFPSVGSPSYAIRLTYYGCMPVTLQYDRPVSRTESRALRCPKCKAKPTKPCIGFRGKLREASHQERVDLALRLRRANR
jgi:hypothetical protein